jgi:succinate dehydrogenase/fumarate reductase flavoprotein subunit
MLTSCSNEDNSIADPTEQILRDGEWTGTGEGRSSSIIAKVTVKDHQVELANSVGIPAEKLSESISRYNAQQKAGLDEDFGRSATEMTRALETPPYYAVRVTPAIHHTMGGLSVNTETQVQFKKIEV